MLTLSEEENGPQTSFDREVFDRAAKWVHEKGGFTPEMLKQQPAIDVMNETYRILSGAVSSAIKQEVPGTLRNALTGNAFIFSGLKTYHSLSEVGLSLTDDKGNIKPFSTFQKDVEKINDKYNKNYFKAEYNHAVASSQMAAKWQDFEADGDRYNLQYRTANDEKVRLEHQALNNITLPPSDPFWSQFLPPNGWNCRCTVVQVRKSKYPQSDSEQAVQIGEEITADPKKQMFRFNPGKELKLFPDKHPYNKAPKEAKEQISQLYVRTRRKEIRKEAKDLPEKQFSNEQFEKPISIANSGIKEWLNQPHKHLEAKNEMLPNIEDVIRKSTYLGHGEDRHNASIVMHIFETTVENDKSWIVVRELPTGECRIHSISDNEAILKFIQKKPSEK